MFQMGLGFYMEIDTCHKSRVTTPKFHVLVPDKSVAKGPYYIYYVYIILLIKDKGSHALSHRGGSKPWGERCHQR